MSDWISVAAGMVFAAIGLWVLTRIDFPVIQDGGLGAVAAALELLVAAACISVALGLAMGSWRDPPGG